MANIGLAVLVGMVDNADRDTKSELIGALWSSSRAPKDSQKIKKKTADYSHAHKFNMCRTQGVNVQGNFKSTKWS